MSDPKAIIVIICCTSIITCCCLSTQKENNSFESNLTWVKINIPKYEQYFETPLSLKFIPPEVEMKFIHLKIKELSIGTQIIPEFSNHYKILGGMVLHFAVEENDLNLIENLIDIEADINVEDKDGKTPLYKALNTNNSHMIQILVAAEADVNFISTTGNSLLFTSIINNEYEVFKKLIDLDVDIEIMNKDDVTPLYKAMEMGNQKIVDDLLKKNASINFKNNAGESLLSIAVSKGRLDIIKQLIQLGADFDTFNFNHTPLYTSILNNNPGITQILLDHGAHPSSISDKGDSLAHTAIKEGRNDAIKKLIVIGANMSGLDADLLTPLCAAIKIDNIEAVRVMLENNVDVNTGCNGRNKEFPINFATSNGSIEVIELLLENGAKPSVTNENGMNPLIQAIFENRTNVFEILAKKPHNVNYITDGKGNTPVHLAIIKRDISSLEKILELGGDPDAVNNKGMTPLCLAATTDNKNAITVLKKHGGNLNFVTAFGDTPLHLAVKHKAVTSVLKLLELGAEKDTSDRNGNTPLCLAILQNASSIVNVLLVKKANVKAICGKETPYLLAISHSTLMVLNRLTNLGATSNDSYFSLSHRAVEADNPEIMKSIIHKSRNASREWYTELIFLAASRGSTKVLSKLLKLGVPVNITTADGFTPLWNATMNNQINATRILIENGADTKKIIEYNRDGLVFRNWTLLHEAAINGNVEILKLLLKNGLATEVRDSREWTPLHYASAQHNVPVIKELINSGADINAKTNRGERPIDLVRHRRTYTPIILEWLNTENILE